MIQLEVVDADDLLLKCHPGTVDCIITDPAYESLEKHRKRGTTTRLKKEWFSIYSNERFSKFFRYAYRALKNNSHLYMFTDAETMLAVVRYGESAGFKFWKPLVWQKVVMGMGYHYRSLYEFILFFEKGKRKLSDLGVPDVLSAPRVRNGYPTEKPVELVETLVRQSTKEGELVVDPFMGSGTTGVACRNLGRSFLGGDISKKAFEIASKRLRG